MKNKILLGLSLILFLWAGINTFDAINGTKIKNEVIKVAENTINPKTLEGNVISENINFDGGFIGSIFTLSNKTTELINNDKKIQKMNLNGIIWTEAGGKRIAIIGGRSYFQGEGIGSSILKKINKDHIILQLHNGNIKKIYYKKINGVKQ